MSREDVKNTASLCINDLELIELKEKSIKKSNSKVNHYLLEGDSLNALEVLLKTHKNKIDLINIKPPMEDNFNNYIKEINNWLNFMNNRLNLARELLKDDGIIFIIVQDNYFAELKLLCDEIFDQSNYLGNFVWKNKDVDDKKQSYQVIKQVEYILFYRKSENFNIKESILKRSYNEGTWVDYKKKDSRWQKKYNPNKFYPIYYNENNKIVSIVQNNEDDIAIYPKVYKFLDGCWNGDKKVTLSHIENNHLRVVKKGSNYEIENLIANNNISNIGTFIDTLEDRLNNSYKNSQLKDITKYIIKNFSFNKNPIILDCFGEEGDTCQAVLELNNEDKKERQFIISSKCGEATYEKIEKLINGYKNKQGIKLQGIEANLNYFKVESLSLSDINDNKESSKDVNNKLNINI